MQVLLLNDFSFLFVSRGDFIYIFLYNENIYNFSLRIYKIFIFSLYIFLFIKKNCR